MSAAAFRILPVLALLLAAGCTSVRTQEAFEPVADQVAERTGTRVEWATGTADDERATRAVRSLLAADTLTSDAAVQVALLGNRRLRADFEDVGVAQADLVQAGLLSNPVFGAGASWALAESHAPDLAFDVAFDFLDVFFLPLRRRVARSLLEQAQTRVTGQVLGLAARTRVAFIQAQAADARLGMERRLVQTTQASYQAARLLREAGNIPAADVLAEQARYEQARLDLAAAVGQSVERREALVRMMGLFGSDAALGPLAPLPPAPAMDDFAGSPTDVVPDAQTGTTQAALRTEELTRSALDASLDLESARLGVLAYAQRLGLASGEALLPALHAGGEIEREEGEWEAGPHVEIALPLFDMGQARRARARAELRRRQALYYAVGVDVRSAARTLAQRVAVTHGAALHYQRVVLPLRAELSAQMLRQYNAMETGVFGLLQAQELEVQAGRDFLSRLAAYWQARADLDLLLSGRLPDLGSGAMAESGPSSAPMADPGH